MTEWHLENRWENRKFIEERGRGRQQDTVEMIKEKLKKRKGERGRDKDKWQLIERRAAS